MEEEDKYLQWGDHMSKFLLPKPLHNLFLWVLLVKEKPIGTTFILLLLLLFPLISLLSPLHCQPYSLLLLGFKPNDLSFMSRGNEGN